MKILSDIGGTFVRFGIESPGIAPSGAPSQNILRAVKKYKASDFETFEKALDQYCHDNAIEARGALRIATAGYQDQEVWKFVNQNAWIIHPQTLKDKGWNIECILNDFEAATWALGSLNPDEYKIMRSGTGASKTQCLMGPGTGLGLGYCHSGLKPFIQKTHGGHFPAASITEEQWLVIQTVSRIVRSKNIPVFENFVSGPGLYNLYKAVCLISGKAERAHTTEDMLLLKEDTNVKQALRLFHEMMGLFAATAVITGNAYGGLYIWGGVIDRLEEQALFDFNHFYEFFTLNVAASVKRDLGKTPVIRVTMPYLALKGLMVMPETL